MQSNLDVWECAVCHKNKDLKGGHLAGRTQVRSDCWPCATKRLFIRKTISSQSSKDDKESSSSPTTSDNSKETTQNTKLESTLWSNTSSIEKGNLTTVVSQEVSPSDKQGFNKVTLAKQNERTPENKKSSESKIAHLSETKKGEEVKMVWRCAVCEKVKDLRGNHLNGKTEVRSDCWPCATKRLFRLVPETDEKLSESSTRGEKNLPNTSAVKIEPQEEVKSTVPDVEQNISAAQEEKSSKLSPFDFSKLSLSSTSSNPFSNSAFQFTSKPKTSEKPPTTLETVPTKITPIEPPCPAKMTIDFTEPHNLKKEEKSSEVCKESSGVAQSPSLANILESKASSSVSDILPIWLCTVCLKSKDLKGSHLNGKTEVRSDCWPCATKRLFRLQSPEGMKPPNFIKSEKSDTCERKENSEAISTENSPILKDSKQREEDGEQKFTELNDPQLTHAEERLEEKLDATHLHATKTESSPKVTSSLSAVESEPVDVLPSKKELQSQKDVELAFKWDSPTLPSHFSPATAEQHRTHVNQKLDGSRHFYFPESEKSFPEKLSTVSSGSSTNTFSFKSAALSESATHKPESRKSSSDTNLFSFSFSPVGNAATGLKTVSPIPSVSSETNQKQLSSPSPQTASQDKIASALESVSKFEKTFSSHMQDLRHAVETQSSRLSQMENALSTITGCLEKLQVATNSLPNKQDMEERNKEILDENFLRPHIHRVVQEWLAENKTLVASAQPSLRRDRVSNVTPEDKENESEKKTEEHIQQVVKKQVESQLFHQQQQQSLSDALKKKEQESLHSSCVRPEDMAKIIKRVMQLCRTDFDTRLGQLAKQMENDMATVVQHTDSAASETRSFVTKHLQQQQDQVEDQFVRTMTCLRQGLGTEEEEYGENDNMSLESSEASKSNALFA